MSLSEFKDLLIIQKVLSNMMEYQKNNNIKKQCVTNTQYLYDVIKNHTNLNIKAKAVIVYSSNEETDIGIVVSGHLVLEFLEETPITASLGLIEASYEIFSLPNTLYFANINDFMNSSENKNDLLSKIGKKDLIESFIKFHKLAEEINSGGLVITDKDHYNKQADYIEKLNLRI